jgi:hypothetical protein
MPYEKLSEAEEMKLIIIENFIDYYFHHDKQREIVKESAFDYVISDHANELAEILPNKRTIKNW